MSEELALLLPKPTAESGEPGLPVPEAPEGVFCVAGSLMPQTAAQVEDAIRHGIAAFELDSFLLLEKETRERHAAEQARSVCSELAAGRSALLYASNDKEKVAETKRRASALGLSNAGVSRLVSAALSDAAAMVVDASGTRRLLVAGGETSAAVCARLGIGGLRILKEIEPGLPSCLSLGEPQIRLVLKSGSFGSERFFTKAIGHLNALP
nr:nucleotide-binding domain containing protein [Cohnella zeiphila]